MAEKRNYGIDLLRILSMQMIVILHILGAGGVLAALPQGSLSGRVMWLLEAACFCAVNCFAIASGYVMCRTGFKLSRIVNLWLQVLFYTLGFTVISALVWPGSAGLRQWWWGVMPVATVRYWYFTAYFAMFFFIPFFNRLIESLDKRQHGRLILVCAGLFTLGQYAGMDDIFLIHDGYSFVWLSVLYFIGAYLKKYPLGHSAKTWLLGYAAMTLISWLPTLLPEGYLPGGLLLRYTSPTMLASAVCLVAALSRVRLCPGGQKAVAFLAPMSFGVYLIHCNPIVWFAFIEGGFARLAELPLMLMIPAVLAAGAAVYITCSAMDFVRIWLFRLLRVRECAGKLSASLEKILVNIEEKADRIL